MNTVFLALGSNIGDRLGYLRIACRYIRMSADIKLIACSDVYLTKPLGIKNQPDFFNAVLKINTASAPLELLRYIKWIETSIGRSKTAKRWGPREIDIDILTYSDTKIKTNALTLPHKELYNRFFWLKGLSDIDAKDPYTGLSWKMLAGNVKREKNDCVKIYSAQYLTMI